MTFEHVDGDNNYGLCPEDTCDSQEEGLRKWEKWNAFQEQVASKFRLSNAILRIARNLLETRENIKIESHSFYHIICDKFSWGSSKKKLM